MKNKVDKAYAMALVDDLFADKVDKGGHPYTRHLYRIASKFEGQDDLWVVALLHDILEDTDYSLEDLKANYCQEIVDAIVALTRMEGESYMDFIRRISLNEMAVKVKLADLKDNMDVTRLKSLERDDFKRIEKYHKAWRFLNEAK